MGTDHFATGAKYVEVQEMNETRGPEELGPKQLSIGTDAISVLSVTIRAPLVQAAVVAKAINDAAPDHLDWNRFDARMSLQNQTVNDQIIFSVTLRGEEASVSLRDGMAALAHDLEERLSFASVTVGQQVPANGTDPKPPAAPRYWKAWVASMLGVYPLLVLIYYALQPLTQNLPGPVSLFLVALVLTGVNGVYVAPFLGKRLRPWLTR
ncbi:hypothetical protein [Maritimibacter alkaliphilus]|uniref:Uncharacterized protein n=1 Tax=Maritimibacter alkaliphilus HTCC2654 TaxID=314271 RepID=A3VMI9_9RHOB|nr:hypothetical protein [Maritimibacter alkaliphilus]EAQ10543.1 hypothetical protein RB2654_00100 [Rhodobacterales bacterium HTCC2654] [Maritimibacter alkaliphilus HTCC2654]